MSQITDSTLDAFVDELGQTIVYEESKKFFAPLRSSLGLGGSNFDKALASALDAFEGEIKRSVMRVITYDFLKDVILKSTIASAYIIGGGVLGTLKNTLKSVLTLGRRKGLRGNALLKLSKGVKNDNEEIARIEKVKLAFSLGDSLHTERRHKEQQHLKTKDYMRKTLPKSDRSLTSKFKIKMESGTFSESDLELFQSVTGQKPKDWKTTREQLNNVSNVAKDAEGQILNSSQLIIDLLASEKLSRFRTL